MLNPSPDITSMMLMSAPMVVLYFGGILLCHYSTKRRPKALGGE
jgi:Sec-independent protein secretion pathway component TatC